MRAEELLRHREFLRRLATGLLRGEADADDVVQDAYVKALQRTPRSPGPWLARVVRRLAFRKLRERERRDRRERAAAKRTEGFDAAEAVARLELQRRLVDAVLALPEPYRATVFQRYFEDLSAREIAKRTRTPHETVKTRLARALKSLRKTLATDSTDWRFALLPLALPKRRLVQLGGLLVSAKKTALIAFLPFLGMAVGVVGHAAFTSRPSPSFVHAPPAVRPQLLGSLGRRASESESASRDSTHSGSGRAKTTERPRQAQDAAPTGSLEERVLKGRVTDSAGSPLSKSWIRVGTGPYRSYGERTDNSGCFTFKIPKNERGPFSLGFPGRPDLLTNVHPVGPEGSDEVRLVADTVLRGSLTYPDGSAPTQGVVLFYRVGASRNDPVRGAYLDRDEDGSFLLAGGLLPGSYRVIYTKSRGNEDDDWYAFEEGGIVTWPFDGPLTLRMTEGATIEGTVTDAAGKPLPHYWVRAVLGFTKTGATTDDSGRFRFVGLAANQVYKCEIVRGDRSVVSQDAPAGSTGVALVVPREVVGGSILGIGGKPIHSGLVLFRKTTSEDSIAATAMVDALGAFPLPRSLESGRYRVTYKTSRGGCEWQSVSGGEDVYLDASANLSLQLAEGATLAGTVTDTKGTPQSGVWIRVTRGDMLTGDTTGPDGHFEVKGLLDGTKYTVTPDRAGHNYPSGDYYSGTSGVSFILPPAPAR